MNNPSNPVFFTTPAEFRAWLEKHHDEAGGLWVGFYKKVSGRPGITKPEAIDEALCFGWIDGRSQRLDDVSYTVHFTPRRPRSIWSAANIRRVKELTEAGRMHSAGLKAFEQRTAERSSTYSYEQKRDIQLDDADEQQFRANNKAWDFFQTQAPSYRKAAIWWVISAKKEATRKKRLATLIEDSEHGRTIPPLTRRKRSK